MEESPFVSTFIAFNTSQIQAHILEIKGPNFCYLPPKTYLNLWLSGEGGFLQLQVDLFKLILRRAQSHSILELSLPYCYYCCYCYCY